jgi:hypothetical protein
MVTTQIAAFTATLVLIVGTASAADTCKGGPKSQWKSVEQVKKAAIEGGFTKIAKIIIEDGCYEVVTINAEEKIVGVQFDPVTLKLEKIEPPR